MKPRKLYYRRKEGSIIIEGKQDGKSIHIWTLPDPQKFLSSLIENSSFFKQEKIDKIMEKVRRLDIKEEKVQNNHSKIPPTNIIRTFENDDKIGEINEDLKKDSGTSTEDDIRGVAELGDVI